MSVLKTIEERLSRVVEGAFGRAFRTSVQPVEIARRLVREMDDHRHASLRRVYVPNVYRVYLSRDDQRQFEGYERSLVAELEEYLAEHARRNGYSLLARPRVDILVDEDLGVGAFGIGTDMVEPPGEPAGGAAGGTRVMPAAQAGPIRTWKVTTPGATHPVTGERTTIGRGRHNDVVIADASVSRDHAELVQCGVDLVVRDLGSTNGVLVNDMPVTERVLGDGDRVVLGNVELVVSLAEGGQ